MSLPDTFKALSDPVRREILVLLRNGRITAGDISCAVGLSPAALSYHLSILKKAGLVTEYRQKNYIFYELNTTVFQELMLWISQFGGDVK